MDRLIKLFWAPIFNGDKVVSKDEVFLRVMEIHVQDGTSVEAMLNEHTKGLCDGVVVWNEQEMRPVHTTAHKTGWFGRSVGLCAAAYGVQTKPSTTTRQMMEIFSTRYEPLEISAHNKATR